MDHQQLIKVKCNLKNLFSLFDGFHRRENVTQRLRDPLLLGSATILAASKVFCYGINSHIHDKVCHFLRIEIQSIFVL